MIIRDAIRFNNFWLEIHQVSQDYKMEMEFEKIPRIE